MKSLFFGMVMAAGCADAVSATAASTNASAERPARQATPVQPDVPDNIGTATMEKNGTLVLSLIYWFPDGGHTSPARFDYPPRHPEYKKVLRHIGGIKPGEIKGVKPWPTRVEATVPKFDGPLPPEFKDYRWPDDKRSTK